MKHCLYILKSLKNNKFYIGQTNNFKDRLRRHNNCEVLSTKSGVPWILMYKEEYNSRKEAVKREVYFKSQKSRRLIEQVINRRGVEQ